MSLTVGELVAYLDVDKKPFDQKLGGAEKDLEGLAKRGSRISGKMAALVGAGVGLVAAKLWNMSKGAVDAFGAMEDATGAAGVQFGKELPKVLDFADKATATFNLSKRSALEAANTFGTLGKSAGLAGDPLVGFSTKMTGLAGDLASFKGTSTEQAIEAVGAALRGESEPIRAYGVMLDEATIKAEAMGMGLLKPTKNLGLIKEAQARAELAQRGYNKAVKEHGEGSDEAKRAGLTLAATQRALATQTAGVTGTLTVQQKVLATQSAVWRQTTDAQGDAARTMGSTANTAKRLANESDNAQVALGKKLAPAVTKVRQVLLAGTIAATGLLDKLGTTEPVVKAITGAFQSLSGSIPTPVLQAAAVIVGTLVAVLATQAVVTRTASAATSAYSAVKLIFISTTNAETGATTLSTVARVRGTVVLVAQRVATVAMTVASKAARVAVVAWTVAQWLLNVALTANPIGLVVVGIALLIAGLVLAWKKSDTFRDAVKTLWGWLKKFIGFTPLGALILNFDKLKSAVGWVIDKVQALWNKIESLPSIPGLGALGKAGGFIGDKLDWKATGGTMGSGWTVVGERGPELVRSPGAKVFTNADSERMLRGGHTVNMPVTIYGTDNMIERAIAESSRRIMFQYQAS